MRKGITVFLGILTAIIFGMVMLAINGYSPLDCYRSILEYSIFSNFGLINTINRMALLLMAGMAAAIALGSGASNLGIFGQIMMGGIVATIIGLYVPIPGFLRIPLMLAGSALAGGTYSGLAALGKKFLNMNEFITTLMLNFIANNFTTYLITNPLFDPSSSWPMSKVVPAEGILPALGSIDSAAIIVFAVYIVLIIYATKSRQGYELRIMGSNNVFASVGGCETDKNFMRVMFLSGALSGLIGGLMLCGANQQHRFFSSLGSNFANDGIMISIISGNSVVGVIIYALFFSIIQSGATGMQLDTGVPSEFTTILLAITVLCVVAFRSYSGIFINKITANKKARSLKG